MLPCRAPLVFCVLEPHSLAPTPASSQCAKPPHLDPRTTKVDPVTFVNDYGAPLDLFYWNGTCEELVSWSDIGGVQPFARKHMRSTHGHTFRARSAASGKMLMQHTLTDVVIRPCETTERGGVAPSSSPRAVALARATADLARDNELLKRAVERQLALIMLSVQTSTRTDAVNGSFARGSTAPACTDAAALPGSAFGIPGKAWF